MRRVLVLTTLMVFIMATAAWAADVKIGVLNMKEVLEKSEAGQEVIGKLKGKHEKLVKELEKRKEDLEKMKENLQKQAVVLSLEAKQDKEMDFKRKVRDYQDLSQSYQRRFKSDQDRMMKPVYELLEKVITDYGKKNKFTVLLDMTSMVSGILYADDAVMVTKPVILEMNRAWRAKNGKKK